VRRSTTGSQETSERWNPSSTPRIQFRTPRVPSDVPQTMVERNGSFETVDDDSKVVGQLLLSLLTSAAEAAGVMMPPTPPPHASTRDEPLSPAKQATATNTVTATRTSVSDEPKDFGERPDPPGMPTQTDAAAASGGDYHITESGAVELFRVLFKLSAMMFGFVMADVAGAFVFYAWADMLIVGYFVAETLLQMFQQRQQSPQSSSLKNA
jgi:hypothetical protein